MRSSPSSSLPKELFLLGRSRNNHDGVAASFAGFPLDAFIALCPSFSGFSFATFIALRTSSSLRTRSTSSALRSGWTRDCDWRCWDHDHARSFTCAQSEHRYECCKEYRIFHGGTSYVNRKTAHVIVSSLASLISHW